MLRDYDIGGSVEDSGGGYSPNNDDSGEGRRSPWSWIAPGALVLGTIAGIGWYISNRDAKEANLKIDKLSEEYQVSKNEGFRLSRENANLAQDNTYLQDSLHLVSDSLGSLANKLSLANTDNYTLIDSLDSYKRKLVLAEVDYSTLRSHDSVKAAQDSAKIAGLERNLTDKDGKLKYLHSVITGETRLDLSMDSLYEKIGFASDMLYTLPMNNLLKDELPRNISGTSGRKAPYFTKDGMFSKDSREELFEIIGETGVDNKVKDFIVKRNIGEASVEEEEAFVRQMARTVVETAWKRSTYSYFDYLYLGDPLSEKHIETDAAKIVLGTMKYLPSPR